MVYSIDSVHLNNGHMYPTQLMQIFISASYVQPPIFPERLNQIYIVAHRWKEEIFSFPTICIKFKGSGYDRSSTCERKSVVGINTISPISVLQCHNMAAIRRVFQTLPTLYTLKT